MKKYALRITVFCLIAGILVGIGIRVVEHYAAKSLLALLNDEAQIACNCTIQYDSVEVSLFRLRAFGRNIRLVENGQERLHFDKAYAYFSLNNLLEHEVVLTELRLRSGFSDGVGPSSATYKFIDWLAAPIPPEHDLPGRWKIKLQKIKMRKARFAEIFQIGELRGEDVNLDLTRRPDTDFDLNPSISKLVFVQKDNLNQTKTIELGKLSSSFTIRDQSIDFEKIRIDRGASFISTNAGIDLEHNNKLTGNFAYQLDSKSLELPNWIDFILTGQGILSDYFKTPALQASMSCPAKSTFLIQPANFSPLQFDKFSGDFSADTKNSEPKLTFSKLEASGDSSSLTITAPITISSKQISGELEAHADFVKANDASFKNIVSNLKISGSPSDPKFTFTLSADQALLGALSLEPLTALGGFGKDNLTLSLSHEPANGGSLTSQAEISLASSENQIKHFELKANDFRPIPKSDALIINGTAKAQGPFDIHKIQGDSSFTISNNSPTAPLVLSGVGKVGGGIIELSASSPSGRLISSFRSDLNSDKLGEASLKLTNLALSEINPAISCGSIDAALNYSFNPNDASNGSGALKLNSFSLGCAPVQIKLSDAHNLPIQEGSLLIPKLTLVGSESNLKLDGSVAIANGLDIAAQGKLQLNALLGLIPSIDDLQGAVTTNLSINGPFGAPVISGNAQISEGEVAIESADVSASEINGGIQIDNHLLQINNVTGMLNGGDFSITGSVNPFDLDLSDIEASLSGVSIEPTGDTSMVFGGRLQLSRGDNGRPSIHGTISVNSAEFQRNISLPKMVRALASGLLERAQRKKYTQMPDLDLNVSVVALHNIFINTNWVGAELQANLLVSGTLANPLIKGSMETLSGWFGIKNRQFDITSGHIIFKPGYNEPLLDIISETSVRGRSGEPILVILEASGSLSNPKITLTSDNGLPEKDILALLPGSRDLVSTTRVDRSGSDGGIGEIPLFDKTSLLDFNTFFRDLTRIDSIGIEPAFNTRLGVIEPTVIATKRLDDDLSLIGSSFFGSTESESSVRLSYDMTPSLNLAGIAETVSTKSNTALGADLTYTILARTEKFLDITIHGQRNFKQSRLLEQAKLAPSTRLAVTQLDSVRKNLVAFYNSQGYFKADATISCLEGRDFCRKIDIYIHEGPQGSAQALRIEGENLPESVVSDKLVELEEKKPATEAFLKRREQYLLSALRAEGYIGARVSGSYEKQGDSDSYALVLKAFPGRPVSFIFQGNTVFTAKQFLDTIRLFKRTQPFGNNTINILAKNIEKKYREAGYINCSVTSNKTVDPSSDRITYEVNINEGTKYKVSAVQLLGVNELAVDHIKDSIKNTSKLDFEEVFRPTYAVEEQLDGTAGVIRDVYIEEGYPEASVTHSIELHDDTHSVVVVYQIVEGKQRKANWLDVRGFPIEVDMPTPPAAPYSIPRANRYLDELLSTLSDFGFINASISSDFDFDAKRLIIRIEPGTRAQVAEIETDGNLNISKEVIARKLGLIAGDPWSIPKINEARRRLLRLGLFSRVEVAPADGKLDGDMEKMIVKVTERPLTTLQVGSGLNSEYGLHLFGEAIDKSLFKDGKTLALRGDVYLDQQSTELSSGISQGIANLRYSDPNLFDTPYVLNEDLSFQKLQTSTFEFDLDQVSFASYLYRTRGNGLSHSFGHTILQQNLFDVSPDAILSPLDEGNVTLSFLNGSLGFDQRDYPLNPTRGYNLNLDYKLAGRTILSDGDFYSIGGRFSYLRPLHFLSDRFGMAVASHLASAWTYGPTEEIPISQRYYLGGRNTVRGYGENELGPRGTEGSVLGGDVLFSNNFELRYLVADNTSVHTFFDAGNVYLRNFDSGVDLGELRYGTGVGVRYLSPIGPIGFDVGHPLPERSGERAIRIYFNIGTIF